MRVTHYARRSFVPVLLALALAGCGKDSSGPSTFDPQGTAADVSAAQDAFASGPTESFAAVSGNIAAVLNGSALVANSAGLVLSQPSKASALYARRVASLVPTRGAGIQARVASIPSELAGVTFVWDESSDLYVASDLSGAPANGVRFLLYAVDPVLFRPVEPVVETGYVDIIDRSTLSTIDVQVQVVQNGVTYLDYAVVASASSSSGTVTIEGFAFNGSTRANFRLDNSVSETSQGIILSLDYHLDVPSRGVSIDWTATFANMSESEVAVTLDLAVSGNNGDVRLVGTYTTGGGTFTVKVNGDPFATITLTAGAPIITGAAGQPLTPEEEQALEAVLESYEGSLYAFSELLLPMT